MDTRIHADHFVDQLRILGGLPEGRETDRTLEAFRAVPREVFAGHGPWKVRSTLAGNGIAAYSTPDADLKWLYQAVLVVLDEQKGINIGEPTLWARFLARTDVRPGARVLQVGAGAGYYTAVLAHLVGPEGKIVAYEIDHALAERGKTNLAPWTNVEVRNGDATTDLVNDDGPFDLVIAFAGVTHVPDVWSSLLSDEGRLLLPLTGERGWGAMILAHRTRDGFEAITLGRCGFYSCLGARDAELASQISQIFSNPAHLSGLRISIKNGSGGTRLHPIKG